MENVSYHRNAKLKVEGNYGKWKPVADSHAFSLTKKITCIVWFKTSGVSIAANLVTVSQIIEDGNGLGNQIIK